ncbi:fimbrial protein [Salmonella enterica]|nr:type 1 fimbrial protein [Salmonella enterica]ECD4598931.1 type 1 fimbrial protein [Salmonella enterica subsp. enterica serovar Waycross]EEO8663787.1 type 1 fimbrial protein [Salmonella enterica subsp. enterica serovar Rubislaw]EEF4188046.1 type 1 fimbrial protein [Salmonella enterica]EEM8198281.1 fimbrial protein [Salmonella enterica]
MAMRSFITPTVKGFVKSRFWGLPVVAGFLMCVMMLSTRAAEQVADGTVHFTGSLLGPSTCTLVNSSLTVDFGTISVNRGGDIPPNPLVPYQTRTFQLTKCDSSVHEVKMTVSFDPATAMPLNDTHIHNDGSSSNVAGILVCPADAETQGVNCPKDHRLTYNETVTGTVNNGTVSFPLSVSLVSFKRFQSSNPDMPDAGDISMTVNFTFEEE